MKSIIRYKSLAMLVVFASCSVAGAAPRALPVAPTDADFYSNGQPNPAEVELGKLLFFDKILSGNFNTSCATCHHPLAGTGDGLSLPVGEGGRGLGATRDTGVGDDAVHERVPRNAPPVFNLGAREFQRMFHDGRVDIDASQPSGFMSPAGVDLPPGLDNVLAVQAMFPVTSGAEMAGQPGENPVADASAQGNLAGPEGVWGLLAERLRNIDEYTKRFMAVYHLDRPSDITFVHAANAIAAFEAAAWRADDSRFDRFLRGNKKALSGVEKRGMRIFYGRNKGNCASCHSGPFLTDHSFRAIAMPQIGPGKGDGPSGHEDYGRERVTGDPADRYRFRVPTLRNVALTAPYGHDGAFASMEAMVRHHLNTRSSLEAFDPDPCRLPPREDLAAIDLTVMSDPSLREQIAAASELAPMEMSEEDIAALLAFLHTLTDPASLDLRDDVPYRVPSGLPLAE